MRKVLFVLSVLIANISTAQRTITGLITDKNNIPYKGVKVSMKNSDAKTLTDSDGKYSIEINDNCKMLAFSKVGFKAQEVEVTGNEINVAMSALTVAELFELSLEELMQVQVTTVATTKATTVFNTPSTVSVINSQMIRQYNFTSISDAIRIMSGISVLQTSSRKQIPTSRSILQDHYPNKVLVMINSIPQWNPVTGESGSLNRISVSDVERIEILKGPASVLYGTNAYSGAINIVLKNSNNDNTGQFISSIGDKNAVSSGVNISRKINDFSLFVAANTNHERGDKRFIVDANNISGYYNDFINYNNLTSILQYKNHSVSINAYSDEQQKLGVDPYFASGIGKPQNMFGYLFNYSNQLKLSDKMQLFSGVGYDWQQRLFPRVQDNSIITDMMGWRTNAFVKTLCNVNNHLNFEIGADYDYRKSETYRNYAVLKDSILTESNLGGKSVYEYSLYGQIGYKISFVNLLYGARFTTNQYFGNNLSHRGTLLLAINDKNSLKFIYGQSFRAPSMFEVYFINSSKTVSGNPDLKPETSNSYEISYQTSLGNLYFQALAFYAQYDNKIFRVTQPFCVLPDGGIGTDKTMKYTNGKEFLAKGVEIESKFAVRDFNIFLNYSYVQGNKGDTIGTNDVYNFKYIAHHTVNGGFYISVKNISFSSVTSYMSKTIGGLSNDIGAQFTTDINLGFSHKLSTSAILHTFSVKNLLDAKLVTPEYVDRAYNEIPLWNQRRILYTLTIGF